MAINRSGLRVVLDTNVIIAAALPKNPASPTREIMARWRQGEFEVLYSDILLAEIIEKLEAKISSSAHAQSIVADFRDLATFVDVPPGTEPRVIAADPDDDHVLACAVIGGATHLVTYDPHFAVLGGSHEGVQIVDALTFLRLVRQQK